MQLGTQAFTLRELAGDSAERRQNNLQAKGLS